jgi:transcriptional regulator with XRE-family HTH domain
MADRDQFGLRLRREREKRGISLDALAAATKVSADLWTGLERDDLSRWPAGIFARAFVRDYAKTIGLDADAVVDEFCRHYEIADRRITRLVKAQADLIGHDHHAVAPDPLPAGRERRRERRAAASEEPVFRTQYVPRLLSAGIDLLSVTAIAAGISAVSPVGFWRVVGPVALVYYSASTVAAGVSPGSRIIGALRNYAPALFAAPHRPTLVR